MATPTSASPAAPDAVAAPDENDNDEQDNHALLSEADRQRFVHSFPQDFARKINAYVAWRQAHGLIDQHCCSTSSSTRSRWSDAEVWRWAVQTACRYHAALSASDANQETGSLPSSTTTTATTTTTTMQKEESSWDALANEKEKDEETWAASTTPTTPDSSQHDTPAAPLLPQVVYCHQNNNNNNNHAPMVFLCDKQGHVLLHVLAARLDPALACSISVKKDHLADKKCTTAHDLYTTSLALYLHVVLLEKTVHNPSFGVVPATKVTLLLDVRAGRGWCNPPALDLIGLTRHLATQLQALYPGLLHQCLLFPVPRPAIWIWKACSGLLPPVVRESVHLVAGGALARSPLPVQDLQAFVDEQVLQHCEQVRLATFAPKRK